MAEALNLKNSLRCEDENNFEKPLTFRNRTMHILPKENSKVQQQLDEINNYAIENEMKINKVKTKTMLFNTAKVKDFTPTLTIDGEVIELVEQMKLLGVQVTSDLKWNANTQYITKKAYNKLWMIRRLKLNGANRRELIDIYSKHVNM